VSCWVILGQAFWARRIGLRSGGGLAGMKMCLGGLGGGLFDGRGATTMWKQLLQVSF